METIADTIRHHPEFWYTHTGPHQAHITTFTLTLTLPCTPPFSTHTVSLCTPDTSWPSLACQQSMETIADTIRHHPEFWYTHTGPHHHFHTHSHPPLHTTVLHTHSVFVHSRHVLTIASMSAIDGNHRRHHPTSPWILVHPHRPTSPLSHSLSPSLAHHRSPHTQCLCALQTRPDHR